MGTTFNSYLGELRVSKSKALLLTTDATIVEVCEQSGFEDQSYFTKVFKKYTGVTPAASGSAGAGRTARLIRDRAMRRNDFEMQGRLTTWIF